MRKQLDVALSNASLRPLRLACYGRLEEDAEHLLEALQMAIRHNTREAWAAYVRVSRTGTLLDLVGWTNHDARNQIKLTHHSDLDLAIDVLRDEAATESAIRAAAIQDAAAEDAKCATAREMEIHNILEAMEAARAAAIIERAATFAAEPPSA